jgi:hypothetical protein
VARRQTEANRRTVVEDVHGMTGEPGDLREPADDVGEMIEGVPEPRPVRRLGKTEARQVGGDDMIVIR